MNKLTPSKRHALLYGLTGTSQAKANEIKMQFEREKKIARQSDELYNRLDEMACVIKSLKKFVKKLSKNSLRKPNIRVPNSFK